MAAKDWIPALAVGNATLWELDFARRMAPQAPGTVEFPAVAFCAICDILLQLAWVFWRN